MGVYMCTPHIVASKGSVKTLPRQRRIVGGVVFFAVHVVSNESTRLILTRISCLLFVYFTLLILIYNGLQMQTSRNSLLDESVIQLTPYRFQLYIIPHHHIQAQNMDLSDDDQNGGCQNSFFPVIARIESSAILLF
jgi:hypothetical protein